MRSFAPLPNVQPALQPGSHLRSGLRSGSASWVVDVELNHAVFATLLTFAVALAHLFGALPPTVELVVLVMAISVFGLPHGALDYLSGRSLLQGTFGDWWFVPFGVGYMGLAGLVVATWLVAPLPSLLTFLLVSAAHFGAGDVNPRLALGAGGRFSAHGAVFEAAGRGSLILIPLLHFHPEAASNLFAHLVPLSPSELYAAITAASPHLFVLSGAVLAVVMAHHLGGWAEGTTGHAQVALEIGALAALFALAPPLVAFIVYFCVWHSFRHSLRQAAKLDPSSPRAALQAFVRRAWPTTAAAILMAVVGYALIGAQSSDVKIIQVVFVGLSALTAPHIVLSWLASRTASVSASTNLQ